MEKNNSFNDTYEIMEAIGAGSGGTVYKAYHKRLQKFVVLKKISDNAKNCLDSRIETDILKNLRHSYLPQVLDFLETEDGIYTVMDYIPGTDFEHIIKNGNRFNQKQVIKYARQICEALVYLHSQNPPIVHADIKPANIMLTPEDNICLIDFNISDILSNDKAPIIACTPGYASPEQYQMLQQQIQRLRNQNDEERTVLLEQNKSKNVEIDARTDIYSLGATFYYMITGQKPSSDYTQTLDFHTYELGISDALVAILEKSTALNIDKRFQSSSEMLTALNALSKTDKRYKKVVWQQRLASLICILFMASSVMVMISGKQRLSVEKRETYEEYLTQMSEAETEEEFQDAFLGAKELFPEMVDAYNLQAVRMYQQGDYTEALKYIEETVTEHIFKETEQLGDLYYIAANCYMELEDFELAAQNYDKALEYNKTDGNIYREKAIAYAKTGEVDEAEDILEQAIDLGIEGDSIYLARGEIAAAHEDIDKAQKYFKKCISDTKDDYTMYRAYIIWSKLYDDTNEEKELLKKCDILKDAEKNLPDEYLALVYERQVQTYLDLEKTTGKKEYLNKAMEQLQAIIKKGWDSYITHYNIAVIYEQLGQIEDAQNKLEDMLSDYGEDYRTYKRLAMLEIQEQNNLDMEDRDYVQFGEYYEKTLDLFKESDKQKDSDMEISVLEQAYQQVKDGKWLK